MLQLLYCEHNRLRFMGWMYACVLANERRRQRAGNWTLSAPRDRARLVLEQRMSMQMSVSTKARIFSYTRILSSCLAPQWMYVSFNIIREGSFYDRNSFIDFVASWLLSYFLFAVTLSVPLFAFRLLTNHMSSSRVVYYTCMVLYIATLTVVAAQGIAIDRVRTTAWDTPLPLAAVTKLLLLTMFTILLFVVSKSSFRKLDPTVCPCGYPMEASFSVCPECGQPARISTP